MQNPYIGKHYVRDVQHDVSEVCRGLFRQLNLSYFHLFRVYADGSAFALFNDISWNDYFYENQYQAEVPLPENKIQMGKFNICLCEGILPSKLIFEADNYFNIHAPISISIAHKGYIDSYMFGASKSDENVVNKYFNNIEVLMRFAAQFQDQAADLITGAADNRFYFAPDRQPQSVKIIKQLSKSIVVSGQQGEVEITLKELEVLRFVCQGFSVKQIASHLFRSPRTIECHIGNLRLKLGCHKKSDLVRLAIENGIVVVA